ncbi:uncharacterized protein L201_007718 [Kwoniella dendrophila CBS 6074]|uniref:UPF3 domain-containing protein n=1 Tax=Kwoniella dendrophila CBS 6074 TaxID=1295534 RepID=A0AAX4K5U4_9TREE
MPAQASSSATARNKLVIRRLPPTLPEELFWKSVSTWINDKTCLWKRFIKGRIGDGYDAHPVHSRAYVLMSSPEALVEFVRGFDGHVFKAKSGAEYQAVIEFAPIQKTPYKAKVKVDARQGTIDDDPDYLSYLESLKAEPVKPVLEVTATQPQPTTTPLLDHLRTQGKNKKSKSSKSAASSSSANESTRRAAALASVTAAATKRAGQAGSGPVMVAGKGREVHIASSIPETTTPEQNEGGEAKKKGRNRKKGKKEGESADAKADNKQPTLQPQSKPQANQGQIPQPKAKKQPGGKQIQILKPDGGRSTPEGNTKTAETASNSRPEKSSKGGKGGPAPSGEANGETNSKATDGAGRGGARAGRGGRGGGKERTGKAQVMEILTRNSAGAGAPTKGGKGGATAGNTNGSGRGGPVQSDAGASRARIDVP